jgi:energy-coupling factor transport system substrate-specific component
MFQRSNTLSGVILALTTLLGVWAFLYPFFVPPAATGEAGSHSDDWLLVFFLVVGLCLVAVVADMETRTLDSKTVALLGVMVATNSLLRPLQGPGGFSVFLILPILCGYVYGGLFGFLLGALSVAVSALFTGGVGPWMPFQMLAVGWVGLSSAALPGRLLQRLWHGRFERWMLAAWGVVVGLLFGAIMNLWFWPFVTAGTSDLAPSQVWTPGVGLTEALGRYAAFYLATSLAWDVWRSVGNALLILMLGPPVLRLLRRFKQRFFFRYEPQDPPGTPEGNIAAPVR